MKHSLQSSIVTCMIMTNTNPAHASEITLIGPGGIRAAGQQLVTAFEKATGHKVTATFGSGGGTKERVIRGEPFDVPIVQLPLEPVVASGHVDAASETWLANVAVGLAVRSGEPKPDISNADAVKRLLLGARAIAYPNAATGAAAGASLNETLQKLGIAEVMQPKSRIAQGGRGAIRNLIKAKGIKQKDFAREVKITAGHLSQILNGHTSPSPALGALMAARLNVSPENLLGGQVSEEGKMWVNSENLKRTRLLEATRKYIESANEKELDHLVGYIDLLQREATHEQDKKQSSAPDVDPVLYELKSED